MYSAPHAEIRMTVTQLNVDAMRLLDEFFRSRRVKRVSGGDRGGEVQTSECRQKDGGAKVGSHVCGHRQGCARLVPDLFELRAMRIISTRAYADVTYEQIF